MINESYLSFGKPYNGEKAIISLTSWKARIKTVGLTIFNLWTVCHEFHIVLVLSIEEFPGMMNDLPVDLQNLEKANICEFLWVRKNYKSIKKLIFTMDKYNSIPVISADDDCLYMCNYANELYAQYISSYGLFPISYRKSSIPHCCCGVATLYPPALFKAFISKFKKTDITKYINDDDDMFREVLQECRIQPLGLHEKFPCIFHNETCPINGSINNTNWRKAQYYGDV